MQSLSSLAAKTLEPGQTLRIILRGNSMYPYLLDGDQLEVRKEGSYTRGDIIVFDLQGQLVAHRVREASSESVIAKGDASRSTETVNAKEIAGKVISVFRGSGKFEMNSRNAKMYRALLPLSSLALRAYRKYLA